MATKKSQPHKIVDVARPHSTAPSPNSRPIIVQHEPIVADPMVAKVNSVDAGLPTAPVVSQHSKTLKPIDLLGPDAFTEDTSDPTIELKTPEADGLTEPNNAKDEELQVAPNAAYVDDPEESTEPEPQPALTQTKLRVTPYTASASKNPMAMAAEIRHEIASLQERQMELEDLIARGTYHVPIEPSEPNHRNWPVLILSLLVIVLALVFVDALFDAKIVTAPHGLPHTHLFSN